MDERSSPLEAVYRYHDGTKHHFNRFARSTGYLDWASQPHPFRRFAGAPEFLLYPAPAAPSADGVAHLVGDVLRHALGLSAWKQFRESRWALRVNPSSGNLHPTEAYVVCGAAEGLAGAPAVYHYAADTHTLEQRNAFDAGAWEQASGRNPADVVLIALTSIHWREAWKYGERAFRYCQHDLGHAIAAVSIAAALAGWRATLLPGWPHRDIASLIGLDRDQDFVDAEREEPACIVALTPGEVPPAVQEAFGSLVDAVRNGRWTGRASQLSEQHVQWTFIDEIAAATRWPGRAAKAGSAGGVGRAGGAGTAGRAGGAGRAGWAGTVGRAGGDVRQMRRLILQRRSAVSFDGRSSMSRDAFFSILLSVMPTGAAPWDALWWTPRVHLALFVHRVSDVAPGIYLLARDPAALERLHAACAREFLWEPAHDTLPFVCLAHGECRMLAKRLSCDQDIAADGFFSLGMIVEFDSSLQLDGPEFYRHLFWETGVVGQVLYLEAEAAGVRSTGIGCFFDDPVHDVLGVVGHAVQSLYHFTIGTPVDDSRLTTAPGYAWELR